MAGPEAAAARSVHEALAFAEEHQALALSLGQDSWAYLSALATLGSVDLSTARAVEPHWDAVAIRHQARLAPMRGARWGVYAARSGTTSLTASPASGGGWTLTGTKAWCSLAGEVSHALVTADLAGGGEQLFEVAMRQPGVQPVPGGWCPTGLRRITTSTVRFDGAGAAPVGAPGWYAERPGFAWGGIGVAAVWFGGAAALAGALWSPTRARKGDQIDLLHRGACDVALHVALLSLRHAASAIDHGAAVGEPGRILAARVRATVARSAEEVVAAVGHALGPAPLATDPVHAARVADLTLYLRQHHAERDLASLGAMAEPQRRSEP